MNFKMCLSFLIFALTANNVSTRIIDIPTNGLANSIGATLSNTGSQVRLENDGGTPQTELSKNGMGSMPVTSLGNRIDEETGNEETGNEGTGDEETGNEGTGDEDTGKEGTGDEDTGKEETGNEQVGNNDGAQTIELSENKIGLMPNIVIKPNLSNQDDEETGNEGTGDEETGNEGTGDEETGNEGTGDEETGNEGTGDEETGNEGTGDEDTGKEGTGDEDTGKEETGDEETGNNQVGNNDGAQTIELVPNKIGFMPSIVIKPNLSNQNDEETGDKETGKEQVGNHDGTRAIEFSKNGIVPMTGNENDITGTKDNIVPGKKGTGADKNCK